MKNFPKLKFIITGDALYASSPFIKLCLDNNWDYIFRLKSDILKAVNQDFDGIISIDSGSIHRNYFAGKDYSYNEHNFNIIRYKVKIKIIKFLLLLQTYPLPIITLKS